MLILVICSGQGLKSDHRCGSPPNMRVRTLGTASGRIKRATEGVKNMVVALSLNIAPSKSSFLSASEGIHSVDPLASACRRSNQEISKLYDAKASTRPPGV